MTFLAQVKAIPGARLIARPIWRWARRVPLVVAWRWQDWRLGIDTYVPGGFGKPAFEDDTGYEPLSYHSIRRIHQALAPLTANDVIFDIGCGKGRIVCFFSRFPVRRCVGIERVGSYAAAARDNARRVRGRRAPIDIREADATTADYKDATIVLLFNPFGPDTVEKVLATLRRSAESAPSRLRIVYVNALHEGVFRSAEWLRCTHTLLLPYKKDWPMKASIWEAL